MQKILLLILLISFGSFGQNDYFFNNYTINEGLSQSVVTSILQDDNGLLWIGTQDGLNRFDGKDFEVFSSDDYVGLGSNYITSSIKSKNGILWFGTMNGLSSYNPEYEKFSLFTPFKTSPFQIEDIDLANSGELYLASLTRGIMIFNPKSGKFRSLSSSTAKFQVKKLKICDKGIAFSTESLEQFFYNFSTKKLHKIEFYTSKKIDAFKIKKISESVLYFGTEEGIFSYNIDTKNTKPEFERFSAIYGKMAISDFYEFSKNNWFIATQKNGLFQITAEGNIFQNSEDIFQRTTLTSNELNVIFTDNQNICWLGSQRGLSSFDPLHKGFSGVGPTGNLSLGLPASNVWCFEEDVPTNSVFIGTDLGVSKYNKTTGRFEHYFRKKEQLTGTVDETTVLALQRLSSNKLLVGCADGLYVLNIESAYYYTFTPIKFNIENEEAFLRTYSLLHYKDNQYFIGTKGGVVLYDLVTKKAIVFQHNPLDLKNTISAGVCRMVTKDKSNKIWFATSAGGLNVLKGHGDSLIIAPYILNDLIRKYSKDYIYSLYEESDAKLWVGTFGSGILLIDPIHKKVKQFKKSDGLPNNVIYSILPDSRDNIWLSTNKGLVKMNTKSFAITNYDELNGLMSNEMNLNAAFKAKNSELYFGGISGFNFFKPNELQSSVTDLQVKFTKFKLENEWLIPNAKSKILKKSISYLNEINLPYLKRTFTIKFTTNDLSNPKLINYKYLLEGSDQKEIFIGNSNEIRFNNLSPGSYILRVYARVGNEPWDSQPAIINVNIASPFWQKIWFWLLVAVVLAILITFFIRRKIDSSRREQVRLEIKIVERTKEIRQQNVQIEAQRLALENERNKVLEQQILLKAEKEKTERILLNVIPESTALELKKHGKASARGYKKVSVLFTDFVGFTKIAEKMKPSELVSRLDVYFRQFDEIITANNLEKIKTIGDAYMCAGGVPVRNNTNPTDACMAALQIQDYISKLKKEGIENNTDYWELRLGINTGEVTAGVIGRDRLAYDIWGSTVNQAQRMEMLSEPGKVTITGNTFNFIEPYFECTYRGKAQSKSKGLIDMYVVDRIKPELSLNGEGLYPNKLFDQIFNLHHYSSINYYKAERHIMKILNDGLSPNLHYHSIEHTQDVVRAVEFYALREGVTDEGLFLLKSAATYHDAGFVKNYEKNEPIGAEMAEDILPKYGYSDKHIERIKELIFVTQIPHQPKNQLEEIICDADLDYLGRDDFFEISDKLKRELMEHGKIPDSKTWDQIQVKFLNMHTYFTKTAIELRQEKKLANLKLVEIRLAEDNYE